MRAGVRSADVPAGNPHLADPGRDAGGGVRRNRRDIARVDRHLARLANEGRP